MKELNLRLKPVCLLLFAVLLFSFNSNTTCAQDHSVAREWNEVLLEAIRNDFARPTVHARNLWHTSVGMYDAWAVYDDEAEPFFLGRTVGNYTFDFAGVPVLDDPQASQEEAMSFMMYRLLKHRFQDSPDYDETEVLIDDLMASLGYDPSNESTDYVGGTGAELGNYIAEQIIQFGFQDGSNEQNSYSNEYYNPVNNDIFVELPGNPTMTDPNRWQPITVSLFIDQSGNPLPGSPPFLSPEWGNVVGFETDDSLKTTYNRDGFDYHVYYDPGDPPYMDPLQQQGLENMYKWGHSMVSVWQSHNDPSDGVMWDISPASIGGITPDMYPTTFEEMPDFYNFFEGGDPSPGHPVNPVTGLPYEPQIVPRGDYARVLAEFWADGPDSETPPGHWFTILNYVSDHPMLEKRWNGEGEILDDLEWDVKSYFVMGGAMHDAAIAAWSIKGWYDYARPVSALRYMADRGQCTDDQLPNYNPGGIPLIPGYIELVELGDPLVGVANINLHKIKLKTWKGPEYIEDPEVDEAGVGWILADYWWPYQRPSFVTPPFAGYISGHSTYSRTAAEVMTLITGDEYFPGGMGIFDAVQDEFLVFEQGPSQTIELQWATYRDASDQCSLSRIWGGIHPPQDDFPGRLIGMRVGPYSFNYAQNFLYANPPRVTSLVMSDVIITDEDAGNTLTLTIDYDRVMDSEYSPTISFPSDDPTGSSISFVSAMWLDEDTFELIYTMNDAEEEFDEAFVQITGALDLEGNEQSIFLSGGPIVVDTKNPVILEVEPLNVMINDNVASLGQFSFQVMFDEEMDESILPQLSFPVEDPSSSLSYNESMSFWSEPGIFVAMFDLDDNEIELDDIDLLALGGVDEYGNPQEIDFEQPDAFSIDTKNPENTTITPSATALADAQVGLSLILSFSFDEPMSTMNPPTIDFPLGDPLENSLTLNAGSSFWVNNTTYRAVYLLADADEELMGIEVSTANAVDLAGNLQMGALAEDAFSIDTKNPSAFEIIPVTTMVNDAVVGSEGFTVNFNFDEPMNTSVVPLIAYSGTDPLANTLSFNEGSSSWIDEATYQAVYDVADASEELDFTSISAEGARDSFGNLQIPADAPNSFQVDTRNPEVLVLSANTYNVTGENTGPEGFNLLVIFDEDMDQNSGLEVIFPLEDPLAEALTPNPDASNWVNASTYRSVFDVTAFENYSLLDVDVSLAEFKDLAGNDYVEVYFEDYFDIQINNVGIEELNAFEGIVAYPNPVGPGGSINVDFGEAIEGVVYEVYNSTGQLIAAKQDRSHSGKLLQIDAASWSSGIYLISISNGDKRAMIRVQKMN